MTDYRHSPNSVLPAEFLSMQQPPRESVDVVNVSSLPPDSEGQPSRSAPRRGGVTWSRNRGGTSRRADGTLGPRP